MIQRVRPKARAAAALAAAAITAVALSSCTGTAEPSSSEPVELTFQSWVPNIDRAVEAFNEAHEDIQVTLETITAGPDGGYAKMFSAVQAGNPADVAQVGYDAVPEFLVNDAVEDITDYVADSADLFTEWQWETGVFDDRVYSIPQASGPLGQFYRKDIFDSLGLTAPTTWDEYYEAAKVIRASDPNRYIAAFAFNQAPWLIGLSQQGGGEWFTAEDDAWNVAIDDAETLEGRGLLAEAHRRGPRQDRGRLLERVERRHPERQHRVVDLRLLGRRHRAGNGPGHRRQLGGRPDAAVGRGRERLGDLGRRLGQRRAEGHRTSRRGGGVRPLAEQRPRERQHPDQHRRRLARHHRSRVDRQPAG